MTLQLWYDLRNAVQLHQFDAAETLLNANPELVNLRNGIGETVLHYLAVEDDREGVAWLHQRGFDLNTKNDFGLPVVFEVAQLEYKELLLWFADAGVDFEAEDREEQNIVAFLREFDKEDMIEFLRTCVPQFAL